MKKKIAYIIAFIGISLALYAQPGSTGGTGGFDDEPQDVPVDGGITLLALAGAVYGLRKLKK
ncbi:MAG: PID-CTERM protein-sorting domain-containing protein [Bacteroidia bacterium]